MTEPSVNLKEENMSPRKVDKGEKKRHIMISAIKVFAEKGLKSAKIADIAAEAGIGKGTVYEYFSGRDEIFIDACNQMIADITADIKEVASSGRSPTEKIRAMTRTALEFSDKFTPEMSAFITDFWAEGIRKQYQPEKGLINIKPVYDEFRETYKRILQDGINCGEFRPIDTHMFASALIGIIDGLQIQWVLDPQTFHFREMADTLIDLFLNGIKNID